MEVERLRPAPPCVRVRSSHPLRLVRADWFVSTPCEAGTL